MIYVGCGTFIAGVPATHLTADQTAQYGGVDVLIGTGLYVMEDSNGTTISSGGNAGNQVASEDPDWQGSDAGNSSGGNEDPASTRGDVE